jgi:peptidoglycan/xylan/chitin deacetylase (PgdA/CDA1 family)
MMNDASKLFAYDPKKALPAPGVLLTFDDHSVANWVAALPILAKHNAKATFFIDRWDTLSKSQIDGLRKIKSAGHAVACHSMRHLGAVAVVKKKSLEAYLNSEVRPAVKLMRDAGFPPSAFAYPLSQRNNKIDSAMLKIFRHLRGGCGNKVGNLDSIPEIFTPIQLIGDTKVLIGTCVQPHSADDPIIASAGRAFAKAAKQKKIVVFYAHDIRENGTKGPKNYVTPNGLEALLSAASKAGLRFYTFDDLP